MKRLLIAQVLFIAIPVLATENSEFDKLDNMAKNPARAEQGFTGGESQGTKTWQPATEAPGSVGVKHRGSLASMAEKILKQVCVGHKHSLSCNPERREHYIDGLDQTLVPAEAVGGMAADLMDKPSPVAKAAGGISAGVAGILAFIGGIFGGLWGGLRWLVNK